MFEFNDEYEGISSRELEAKLVEVRGFSEPFLRFLPREIRTYPSHGYDHSINIVKNISKFNQVWDIRLSEAELFLLYVSAWVHDIGCLVSREGHNMQSSEILSQYSFHLKKEFLTSLKFIVETHSTTNSPYPITEVPTEWGEVRLRLLCAIFRIMDACDITDANCPRVVYQVIQSTLGEESNRYWQAHLNIEKLTFRYPHITVYVDNIEACRFLIEHLDEEIQTVRSVFEDYSITVPIVEIRSKVEVIIL
jgi:hypothetical protein